MTTLREILEPHVASGALPGAVGLVARGDRVEVAAVGSVDTEGTAPMARDSLFRIASITKPVVAAAMMVLVEDGRIALDDPVDKWLPELAAPRVVRTPESPVDDVVPAARPITVFDLLTSRAGYGYPSRFDLPAVALLHDELQKYGRDPQGPPAPDEWMATLSRIPLLHQPGEEWLYNTCSDIQGVLIARVTGQSLPDFLAERIFAPLGMTDTGFAVPPSEIGRFTSYYQADDDGHLELADAPGGQWSTMPAFPSGAGGLVSTADDYLTFCRMMLGGGTPVLSSDSVRMMTTDHLTLAQRKESGLFLEGQGWGFGGSVDLEPLNPWVVPGRYGWVGGTGTTAYLTPSTGTVAVLLTQVAMAGPQPTTLMREFWTYAT